MRAIRILAALLMGGSAAALAQGVSAAPFIPNTSVAAPAAAAQAISFSVYLPLQNKAAMATLMTDLQNTASPNYHKFLTPYQFNARFGPSAASIANVSAALTSQGFAVMGVVGRSIRVSGTAAQFNHAFSTTLSNVTGRDGSVQTLAMSPLVLSGALQTEGVMIPTFSKLPAVHKQSFKLTNVNTENRYSTSGAYWFTDLKQAYDYPSYLATTPSGQKLDGKGVQAAVVISNDALDSDIAAMFTHENFLANGGTAIPTITHTMIDGGAPYEFDASFEASLDVQQILGGAPGASVTLVDIPDLSDGHIEDGYMYVDTALANPKDPTSGAKFQLVNSSFGGCELGDPSFNAMVDEEFGQGNIEGITFVVSSGDQGGLLCPDNNYGTGSPSRFVAGVSTPANSPNATAVGGGNLVTVSDGTLNSAYVQENTLGDPDLPYDIYGFGQNVSGGYWGAGGGLSTIFTKPTYQSMVTTGSATARTLPDIGMQVGGCPGGIAVLPCGPNRSAAVVYDGGTAYGVIGTSVSSPEFVGALALLVQLKGPQGNINPFLYSQAAAQNAGSGTFYHRAIPGFDGKFTNKTPGAGYDYLIGNGTPDIRSLFGMTALPAAGVPQTASNP